RRVEIRSCRQHPVSSHGRPMVAKSRAGPRKPGIPDETGPLGSSQKLSALITSPPALVARAHHVAELTEFFTTRTEPSSMPPSTHPPRFELAPTIVWSVFDPLPYQHALVFGVMMWE